MNWTILRSADHEPSCAISVWGSQSFFQAFTMWFAKAWTQPYRIIGMTDVLGLSQEDDPAHVHDIHATVLHLLGLDRLKLTFRY